MENKKKLLVIDDEEDFLEITKLNLEKTGRFEVMTLSSAKDILQKIHSFKPDLILMDIRMPGVDGLTACDMLNADPVGKTTPVIILSALISDHDKLNAYKLGVMGYLTKPVDKNALISSIETVLGFKK